MLKGLTSTFKQGCNNVELTYSEYIKLGNEIIPIKAQLKDDTYENGNFVGTFILKQITFETESTYDFKNKEFEYYKTVDNESIKIGTFISTDITINDTTGIVKVIGMDYGLKAQIEYTSSLNYSSGTITLMDVWNECCNLSGLESGIDNFPNSDFIVDSDQFSGTGATIRDVFKAISMSSGTFVKVMNDDKIYLIFNEYTSEKVDIQVNGSAIIQDGYKLTDLQLQGDTTQDSTPTPSSPQPINVVSGIQEINVYTKNIIPTNISEWEAGQYDSVSGNKSSVSGRIRIKYLIPVKPSTQYYVNCFSNYDKLIIREYNNIGTIINNPGGIENDTYITTPNNCYYISVSLYSNTSQTRSLEIYKTMFENGDVKPFICLNSETNKTYEEYKGKSYKIDLGKNLLDTSSITSGTYNGVEYSNSNGTITLDKTATSNSFISTSQESAFWLEKGTYTLSANNEITIEGTNNYVRLVSTSGTAITGTSANFSIANNYTTFTLSGRTKVRFQIRTNSGTTYNKFVIKPQLEKWQTATSYTTYKTPIELCKIGDYKDRIFRLEGKNLFKPFNFTKTNNGITFTYSEDGSINSNGTSTANALSMYSAEATKYLITLEAGTYTISGNTNDIRLEVVSSSGASLCNTGTTNKFTINSTTQIFIRANILSGKTFDNVKIYPQLEEGTTATSYEPYGMYNKWYIEKQIVKVVFNGTETNWNYDSNNAVFNNNKESIRNYLLQEAYSNYFKNVVDEMITTNYRAGTRLNNGEFTFRWETKDRIYLKFTDITSVDDLKTWLSSHNLIVYYVLATPTYTEITDSELIEQLNAPRLLEGLNNVSVSSGDLGSPLKISYYNDELDIVEDYTELEDKRDTHPWTCLRLGTSQIDGNNLDYIDQELVDEYGENWLILNDNPFAYSMEKKQQLIMNIFNQIKEFGYSAFVSKTSFKPYLTSGDIIKFKNRDDDFVKSILLRYNHNGEEIELSAPSETSATVNYVRPLNESQQIKNLQIIVDQDKEQITSIAETTNAQSTNINNLTSMVNSQGESIDALGTRITQTTDSITASVSAIQDEIDNGVSLVKTTSVTIDNSGLNVSTDTSKITTTLTNNSFEIKDSGNNTLAFFGYDENEGISKAEMDNLTVTNYFVAGVHRVEKYTEDGEERTGWFYIGG